MWKTRMTIDEWSLEKNIETGEHRVHWHNSDSLLRDEEWGLLTFLTSKEVSILIKQRFLRCVQGLKEGV